MSWCSRRSVLAGGLLAACGFTPVHGPGGIAEGLYGTVAVDEPRDLPGRELVAELERRLGYGERPVYRLGADVRVSEQTLGVTPDQVITRYQLLGQVDYRLIRISDDTRRASGAVSSFASYSATGTPFATRTARRDAVDRLMVNLADKIVSELLATAGDWR